MKGQSALVAGVLIVASAVVISIVGGSFMSSFSQEAIGGIEPQAGTELNCAYADFYVQNGSFDASYDCTTGVNHTLTVYVRNTGQTPIELIDIIMESEDGKLTNYPISQNLDIGETRTIAAVSGAECASMISQTPSGYSSKIKSVHVTAINCPVSDAIGNESITLINCNQHETMPSEYLMGLWHFNSSLSDSSGNGNNANYVGSNLTYAPGVSTNFGQSIRLHGNDYVSVPDSSSLDISSAITIETWINQTNEIRYEGWEDIFINWSKILESDNVTIYSGHVQIAKQRVLANDIENYSLYLSFDDGYGSDALDLSGYGNNGTIHGATWTTGKYGNALSFDGNDYVETNVLQGMNSITFWYRNSSAEDWTFVANVSGTTYVNGELGNPGIYPVYISGNVVQIGKTSAAAYYNGIIDEVRIYGFDLSAEEIKTLYKSAVAIPGNYSLYYINSRFATLGEGQILSNSSRTCANGTCSYIIYLDAEHYQKSNGSLAIIGISYPKILYNTSQGWRDVNELGNFGQGSWKYSFENFNISNGTVGYWSFDSGMGNYATDSSGKGNTGTIYNATWKSLSDCVSGSCMSFDGKDSYVNCGNSSSLNTGNNITVSAWAKTTSLSGSQRILSKTESGGYELEIYDNTPQFSIYSGGSYRNVTGSAIEKDKFYHLAATFDSSVLKLYINGVLSGQTSYSGQITTNSQVVFIGAEPNGIPVSSSAFYFNGSIDEVRIYNRSLSPEEITMAYRGKLLTNVNYSIAGSDGFENGIRDG